MPRSHLLHLANKLKHANPQRTPAISLPSSGTKQPLVQWRDAGEGATPLPAAEAGPLARLVQALPLEPKPTGGVGSAASGGPARTGGFEASLLGDGPSASPPPLKLLAKPAVRLVRLTPAMAREDELLPQNAKLRPQPGAKQGNGRFLYDRNGTPLWYQDVEGNFLGPNHPKLPPVVADILEAAQRTQPSNGFELWRMKNPEGTAEDYLGLAAAGKIKPLPEQLSDAERDGDTETASRIRRVLAQGRVQAAPLVRLTSRR